jgi:hypothetical protein
MANALLGERTLKLKDGTTLTLVFDMEGLIEAEGLYGKPIPVMLADAKSNFFGAVRAMMWGAARAHHPEMTPRVMSELLKTDSDAIAIALGDVHQAAMPEPEKSAGGKASAPKPRPGKRSGGSGAKRA